MMTDRVGYKDEDLILLRLKVDARGRLFVREEIRDLLMIYPNSEVFVEKTEAGQLKLKIQRRGQIIKVWYLSDTLESDGSDACA